jgi:hypothetical protein
MDKAEVIVYQLDSTSAILEIQVEDEKVWLTKAQMSALFDASMQNIILHINNIFKERELQRNSVVKEYLTTASDGKQYIHKSPFTIPFPTLVQHYEKTIRYN